MFDYGRKQGETPMKSFLNSRHLKLTGIQKVTLAVCIVMFCGALFAAARFWNYLDILTGSAEMESSANMVPDSAVFYAWFSLAPRGRQLDRMLDIQKSLSKGDKLNELMDRWATTLFSSDAIDFTSDVLPWIGSEVTYALLPSGGDRQNDYDQIILVEVADPTGAKSFLTDALGDKTIMREEDGRVIWTFRDGTRTLALQEGLLGIGENGKVIDDVFSSLSSGGHLRPLAQHPLFIEAMASVQYERFASFYLKRDLLQSPPGESFVENVPSVIGNFRDSGWIAGSATWLDQAVYLDIVADIDSRARKTSNLRELLLRAPHDVAAIAFSGTEVESSNLKALIDDYTKSLALSKILFSGGGNLTVATKAEANTSNFEAITSLEAMSPNAPAVVDNITLVLFSLENNQRIEQGGLPDLTATISLTSQGQNSREIFVTSLKQLESVTGTPLFDIGSELTPGAATEETNDREVLAYLFHDLRLSLGTNVLSVLKSVEAQVEEDKSGADAESLRLMTEHLDADAFLILFAYPEAVLNSLGDGPTLSPDNGHTHWLELLDTVGLTGGQDGEMSRFKILAAIDSEE